MSTDQVSDIQLVQQAKQGVREAFTHLVDRNLSSLVSFFRYLRVPEDLIDDLVQETFTRAFLNLASYDCKGSWNSWLLTIGKNHYLDIWRKKAKERAWAQTAMPETSVDAGEIAQARKTVQDLLYTLPADLKLLVELRVFQELPFAEIGKLTGDTEGNVRVKFHRTMQRLRETLEREEQHGKPDSV